MYDIYNRCGIQSICASTLNSSIFYIEIPIYTSLIKAYLLYLPPLAEYASFTWSPEFIFHDNKENSTVSKQFAKRLNGLKNLSYQDRLSVMGKPRAEMTSCPFIFYL